MSTLLNRVDYQLHRYIAWGLLVSILIHGIIAGVFASTIRTELKPPQIFTVALEPPRPNKLSSQIVSPSEAPLAAVSKPDAYLSDKDRTVVQEQIKRGAPDSGPSVGRPSEPKPPAQQSAPKTPAQQTVAASRPLALKLDSATKRELFGATKASKASPRESEPQPFSRPEGSGARFFGAAGSADFMPNLPDGDITLLNEKADQFAVFVRRVASQVFSELRSSGWERLSAADVRAIQNFSTVRATLSLSGKLVKVELLEASGSSQFDTVLQEAIGKGASDPHPPPEAARADGQIAFIFKSKSWVKLRPGSNPRSPLTEGRWLLLATGLE